MNSITKQERAGQMLGVDGRFFGVVTASNGRILNQQFKATRYYEKGGRKYRITAEVRFDDQCNNGHESFAVTADIRENGREYMGGCCHDEIVRHFPELAPLIKWHLTSTDGPTHYIANTVYHAGDRDCNGLLKGEVRQIRNGKTGELAWVLQGPGTQYHDGPTPPSGTVTLKWEPWNRVGEGKARELAHARICAVWPEATDAELCADDLADKLRARLPALIAEFRADMLAAGFVWPEHQLAQVAA